MNSLFGKVHSFTIIHFLRLTLGLFFASQKRNWFNERKKTYSAVDFGSIKPNSLIRSLMLYRRRRSTAKVGGKVHTFGNAMPNTHSCCGCPSCACPCIVPPRSCSNRAVVGHHCCPRSWWPRFRRYRHCCWPGQHRHAE